ncbi:hypothetical protein, partial [Thermodesulfatator autotrophicus]|uniref:hypothetical protein n=1 Tax=Thermodesulfatator autotrophicus TaxID=1795632 RepID=UPI001E3DBF64
IPRSARDRRSSLRGWGDNQLKYFVKALLLMKAYRINESVKQMAIFGLSLRAKQSLSRAVAKGSEIATATKSPCDNAL